MTVAWTRSFPQENGSKTSSTIIMQLNAGRFELQQALRQLTPNNLVIENGTYQIVRGIYYTTQNTYLVISKEIEFSREGRRKDVEDGTREDSRLSVALKIENGNPKIHHLERTVPAATRERLVL